MFIDPFSNLRATLFVKFLIALNIAAILILLVVPQSLLPIGVSVAVHIFLAIALLRFMAKVVWPIRAGLDSLIQVVEKHQPDAEPGIYKRSEIKMGSYAEVISQTTALLEKQYKDLLTHSQQVEDFSRVLEKKNAKINESRQRYRKTLDALENGLYLVDDNYVVQTINRAEAAFSGMKPKEIVGQRCYEIFRHRKGPCSDCMPRECMVDGKIRSRLRVEKRRPGRECVNIFCYPIFHDGESQSREAVVYIQDTSRLAMMEAQVVRTEKMASIGQMAAGIAHDLNNYLAGIYGIVQLLQMRFEAAPDERAKDIKLLGRLNDQVEALNLMASNLMIFSYPDRKEMFPLSLNQVIEDALSFSRYELERDQVILQCDFTEELPLIKMEKGQIQQVVLNLMLNGAQAIRERKLHVEFDGLITIKTGFEGDSSIYFSIRDNGVGISSESQQHLFDPFFSTKEVRVDGGATGLGLFTAQTVVNQHQGSMSFSSDLGQGSCFKVVLPLKQKEEPCL